MSTTLFIYDVNEEGIITGGSRLVMQNVKLENVKFLKRLSMIDDADLKQFKKSVK
jgi:glycerol-3-phosphate responsive antiterminator